MPTRPAHLQVVPTPEQRRSRQLHGEVTTLVRSHLEKACDEVFAELAQGRRRGTLRPVDDRVATVARTASRALLGLVTDSLTRLAMATVIQRSRARRAARRQWTEPPRLTAIPGGLRRDAPRPDVAPAQR